MTCNTCSYFTQSRGSDKKGDCGLDLPPWFFQHIKIEVAPRIVWRHDTCSFHSPMALDQDDYEAIYGWGGQG